MYVQNIPAESVRMVYFAHTYMPIQCALTCMYVQNIPFVLIRLAGLRILHGPKHVFLLRLDTERMTTNSLDPFRSFSCYLEGVKARRN